MTATLRTKWWVISASLLSYMFRVVLARDSLHFLQQHSRRVQSCEWRCQQNGEICDPLGCVSLGCDCVAHNCGSANVAYVQQGTRPCEDNRTGVASLVVVILMIAVGTCCIVPCVVVLFKKLRHVNWTVADHWRTDSESEHPACPPTPQHRQIGTRGALYLDADKSRGDGLHKNAREMGISSNTFSLCHGPPAATSTRANVVSGDAPTLLASSRTETRVTALQNQKASEIVSGHSGDIQHYSDYVFIPARSCRNDISSPRMCSSRSMETPVGQSYTGFIRRGPQRRTGSPRSNTSNRSRSGSPRSNTSNRSRSCDARLHDDEGLSTEGFERLAVALHRLGIKSQPLRA